MGGVLGTYTAVDQALVTQVRPHAHSRTKDLRIMSIGAMVPPALAPLIAGAISTPRDGCPALFTLVGAIAALVYRARSVR